MPETRDTIPVELRQFPFLHFLTKSKYLAILYDETGKPLFAANRTETHPYFNIIETLMQGPVHSFFNLPYEFDLNRACHEGRVVPSAPALDVDAVISGTIPGFSSKNVLETPVLIPNFITRFPITHLHLVRLSEKRFLGIVSFAQAVLDIMRFGHSRLALMADPQGRILGYNALFNRYLKTSRPDELLNRPVSDVLRFNRDPFAVPQDVVPRNWKTILEWKNGRADFPLALMPGDRGRLGLEKAGMRWQAPPEDRSCLLLTEKFPTDDCHFSIEMEFLVDRGWAPNVFVRGIGQSDPSDYFGYGFTQSAPGQRALKRGGNFVMTCPLPEDSPAGPRRMTWRRVLHQHTLEFDGRALGQWHENAPFVMPSEDLFYMNIRSGHEILLRELTLKSAPVKPPRNVEEVLALNAFLPGHPEGPYFQVKFFQGVLGSQNYTFYEFEDVTALRQNLSRLQKEHHKLVALLHQEKVFIGASAPVRAIRENLYTVAQSDLSILIEGETGTGKELLAQNIHQASPRRNGPFVKIDCSAIPSSLMESELFGHERGAFTGALSAYTGRFEQAQGGTVFLDEVANLPLEIQAKLLSVLQDYRIRRVGGNRTIDLNVRLICASNIPLKGLITQGRFRTDLYYRLNQFLLSLPPLRERREDIPLLAETFVREADALYKKGVEGMENAALDRLCSAAWRGNVRELRNAVFRAVLFCRGKKIAAADLSIEEAAGSVPSMARERRGGARRKCGVTKKELQQALKRARGVVSVAIRELVISRDMAYRLINRYKLKLRDFR